MSALLAAIIIALALAFAGCATGGPFALDRDMDCKGKAMIQVGPYAGSADCGDGFTFRSHAVPNPSFSQPEPAK